MKLENKTVFISGATSGIGLEFARQLAEKGNKLILSGRNVEKIAHITKNHPEYDVIKTDVSDPESVQKTIEYLEITYGSLDMVINSAGIMRDINLERPDQHLPQLTSEIDTNFRGTIQLCYGLLPLFINPQKQSIIVTVSSALAWVPAKDYPIYSGTKSGVHFFTRSLRAQLQNTTIQVTEVAPPLVSTQLLGHRSADDSSAMKVEDLVKISINGIEKGKELITPGIARWVHLFGRLTPHVMSKIVDRTL